MKIKRDISHFNLIDWDFKGEDSKSFVHNFCWYPSRFIPIIPSHLIQSLSHKGDTILDPYCGSGTTVLEGLKLGRNAIGVDLNPIASFIAEVKVNVFKRNDIDLCILQEVQDLISSANIEMQHATEPNLFKFEGVSQLENLEMNAIPNIEENSKWYHPLTLKMLVYILNVISTVKNKSTQDLLKLFFISILIPSSGHENKKPYTYYADNVKPKSLLYKNAVGAYASKIRKFLDEYAKFTNEITCKGTIINSDIRHLANVMEPYAPIDLIVTSPPYLSVTDYITGYRLVYLWDLFPCDINTVKRSEIGARWRRKVSTSFTDYARDLQMSLLDMSNVLKAGGYLCLILGEAMKHREVIIDELQAFATASTRLELQDVYSRKLSKNFFLHPQGGVPTEDILIFQRN